MHCMSMPTINVDKLLLFEFGLTFSYLAFVLLPVYYAVNSFLAST
jgi:hypothetical protein